MTQKIRRDDPKYRSLYRARHERGAALRILRFRDSTSQVMIWGWDARGHRERCVFEDEAEAIRYRDAVLGVIPARQLTSRWRFLTKCRHSRGHITPEIIWIVRWRGKRTQFGRLRISCFDRELSDCDDVVLHDPEGSDLQYDQFTMRAARAYWLCPEHAGAVARAARCAGRPLFPMLSELFPSLFIPGFSDPPAARFIEPTQPRKRGLT
jgi:hypothetical protein